MSFGRNFGPALSNRTSSANVVPVVRSSWLILSMVLHTSAVGAVVAVGVWAGEQPARRPAQVEVQTTTASSPAAAPAIEPPHVVVEGDVSDFEPILVDPEVVEPIAAPEPAARRVERLPQESPDRTWSLQPLRPAPPPEAPAPVEQPVAEPTPVPPADVAPPAADVPAAPRADNPPPNYPEADRVRGHEGSVGVRVLVDEFGTVQDLELVEPCAHPGLNREALRAVRHWRFAPAQRGGSPAAGVAEVVVEFRLRAR